MNASANQRCESGGGQMQVEKKETVDFVTPAGQGGEHVQRVDVVHEVHPRPVAAARKTSGGLLENAAVAVVSTLESAKDALPQK